MEFDMEKKFEWDDNLVHLFAAKWATRGDGRIHKFTDDFKREQSKPKFPKGILEYRRDHNNRKFVMANSSRYNSDNGSYQAWCKMCSKEEMNIYSVENRSGETLTIGDETNYQKILCFKIYDGKILVGTDREMIGNIFPIAPNMNDVHPKKETIRTEDGHEMESYKNYTSVDKKGMFIINAYIPDIEDECFLKNKDKYLFFKDMSNAEKYIEENKPRFSKKEIDDAIINSTIWHIADYFEREDHGKINPNIFKEKLGL